MNLTRKTGQAGLEAVFQVPMPGDSGSSPDAGSISKLLLDPGDLSLQPQRIAVLNKSEKVLWTIAKILLLYYYYYIIIIIILS